MPDSATSPTPTRLALILNSPAFALVMVMLAATLWATVGVASRLIPHNLSISDDAYGFARTAVAGPALLLLCWLRGGSGGLRPKSGGLSAFLMFGLCCAIFQIGLFRSFTLLGVTITVFITVCLPPVIAVAWGLWTRPGVVSRPVQIALVLAITGLLAFSSTGFRVDGSAGRMLEGLALSVIASVAFVLMSNAARGLAADHSPLLVAGLGLSIASLFLAVMVFLFSPGAWHVLAGAVSGWQTGAFLLYLGLFPTALAYLLYCTGMARCRTAAGGLVASMIEPAVAAALALLFLQEWLSIQSLVGCAMLFAAMLVLWREEQRLKVAQQPRPSVA